MREEIEGIARHWRLTGSHLAGLGGLVVGALVDGWLLALGPPATLWLIAWIVEIAFVGGAFVLFIEFVILLGLGAYERIALEWYRVRNRVSRAKRAGDDLSR